VLPSVPASRGDVAARPRLVLEDRLADLERAPTSCADHASVSSYVGTSAGRDECSDLALSDRLSRSPRRGLSTYLQRRQLVAHQQDQRRDRLRLARTPRWRNCSATQPCSLFATSKERTAPAFEHAFHSADVD
jgi:hypothetical protein